MYEDKINPKHKQTSIEYVEKKHDSGLSIADWINTVKQNSFVVTCLQGL